MTAAHRLTNYCLLVFLVAVSISIVLAVYLYAFDQNPASEVFNSPVPVDKDVYHIGDSIYATIEYCRYTQVPHIRHLAFEDTLVFYLPPESVVGLPLGCGKLKVLIAVVPNSLPPGTYRIVGRTEYRVNFLATRYTDAYTETFQVIK